MNWKGNHFLHSFFSKNEQEQIWICLKHCEGEYYQKGCIDLIDISLVENILDPTIPKSTPKSSLEVGSDKCKCKEPNRSPYPTDYKEYCWTCHKYIEDKVAQNEDCETYIVLFNDLREQHSKLVNQYKSLEDKLKMFDEGRTEELISHYKRVEELEEKLKQAEADLKITQETLGEQLNKYIEKNKRAEKALKLIASHKFTPEMEKLKDEGVSYERILEDIATNYFEKGSKDE
jgi:hypothetical protein